MMELKLPLFNINDILFVEKYLMCVEPIAVALDKLQGEFGIYYGVLLPTLFSTEKYVEKLYHNTNIELCKPLVKVIDDGLKKRFYSILNLVDADFAIIATSIHPYFKLKWNTINKEFNNKHINLKGLLNKALLSIDKHTDCMIQSMKITMKILMTRTIFFNLKKMKIFIKKIHLIYF